MPARRLMALAATLIVLLAGPGCKGHVVGLHDLVLTLRPSGRPMSRGELGYRVAARLAAADLGADVEVPSTDEVRVRVDEDLAPELERLLVWRGGLALALLDPDAGAAGGQEPLDAAEGRLRGADPPGHRRVLGPLRRSGASPSASVREVLWPPAAELDTEAVFADGARVVVPLNDEDARAVARVASEASGRSVAVVRDRTVLAVLPRFEAPSDRRLVAPLGDSIEAYTDAADLAHLLASPRLPPFVVASRRVASLDWSLALLNLTLPFAVSLAWLLFVRRFDRAQPEPMWLVGATFVLGAVAVVPAGLVEYGLGALSPYLNPTLLTFGHAARALPLSIVGFIVTVGVTEEGCKLLATWSLATHRREFDEPVDGMVYAAAAALGFAAAENLRYLAIGRVAGALVASRAFMSVPAHLFFSTIWGYGLGRRLVEKGRPVWPLFLGAVTLHGLFDALLSTDGGGPWAALVGLVVSSIFIVHLRLALRHGAVVPADGGAALAARGQRELFRMGSRAVFAGFVALLYACSLVVFALTLIDHTGRAWTVVAVASAVTLALLGWAARGLATALPLDAVVDDHGVTFAGAAVPYRDVVRIERRKASASPRRQEEMVVVGSNRELTLGPASHETMDALAHALAMRLSSAGART